MDHGYKAFSRVFVPTLHAYDRFECRAGLQYTRIVSETYGIRTIATVFFPVGDNRVLRDIKIANRGDNIAALLHRLGVVQLGERKRLITQLGWDQSVEQAPPSIRGYRDPERVDAAF